MAEKLKGLFVLFAGYMIKNTASILDSTNITKSGIRQLLKCIWHEIVYPLVGKIF